MLLTQALYTLKARYYDFGRLSRFAMKLAFGTLWTIALTQIKFPLPFSPVPLCLGPNAAVFLGALLGPAMAISSIATFITLGTLGLPVFAGVAFGPTWGYLIGYMGSAWVMGRLMQRMQEPTFSKVLLAALGSNLVLYISGCAWLSLFVGAKNVLSMGLLPFMPGMLFKDIALTFLYMRGKKALSV